MNSFSWIRKCFRASSHSFGETTLWFFRSVLVISSFLLLVGGPEIDYCQALNDGSDKCGGIQMDSLIAAVARARSNAGLGPKQ